jgi:hypothetical protein
MAFYSMAVVVRRPSPGQAMPSPSIGKKTDLPPAGFRPQKPVLVQHLTRRAAGIHFAK